MLTGLLATPIVLVLLAAPLGLLTAVGSRRRGYTTARAFLAGLAFPVTWTLWYLQDTGRRDLRNP